MEKAQKALAISLKEDIWVDTPKIISTEDGWKIVDSEGNPLPKVCYIVFRARLLSQKN